MQRSSTSPAGRRRHRGFTLFELIVVICVVATLLAVAFNRFVQYQEDAERAAMRTTLASFKTALQLQVAELLIARQADQIEKLQGENPVLWLAEPPSNYLGAFPAGEAREKPPGNWYFDTRARQLVFLARYASSGVKGGSAAGEQRFATRIDYETVQSAQGPVRRLSAVTLAPVE